jgi:hypothetical protein
MTPDIVWHDFPCPVCETLFRTNRAEPQCAVEHPGQWHLQIITWSPDPCVACESWRQPFEEMVLDRGPDVPEDLTLMFPPVP